MEISAWRNGIVVHDMLFLVVELTDGMAVPAGPAAREAARSNREEMVRMEASG